MASGARRLRLVLVDGLSHEIVTERQVVMNPGHDATVERRSQHVDDLGFVLVQGEGELAQVEAGPEHRCHSQRVQRRARLRRRLRRIVSRTELGISPAGRSTTSSSPDSSGPAAASSSSTNNGLPPALSECRGEARTGLSAEDLPGQLVDHLVGQRIQVDGHGTGFGEGPLQRLERRPKRMPAGGADDHHAYISEPRSVS